MTFNNSILAGVTLAREAIQSEGYTAGTTGWRIERNGDAEFNNLVARGTISNVGSLYTVTIDNGEITISGLGRTLTLNPVQFGFSDSASSTVQFLNYYVDKGIGFRDSSAAGVMFSQSTDTWVKNSDLFGNQEVWTAIPGNNGYTGGFYYKLPDGNVILDGNFGGGVAASPVVVGTLPVGYRPRAYFEYMVARGGAFGTNKLTIATNGQITQWTPDATYNSFANTIFSTLA